MIGRFPGNEGGVNVHAPRPTVPDGGSEPTVPDGGSEPT